MAILLIDKIKQKNNGKFKLMDAMDIDWTGFSIPVENIDAYTKSETDQKIEDAKYDDSGVKASIKANADAITILNGTGDGSVDKKVADAVAGILNGAPEAYDTLKEISDWISTHGKDAASMNSQINTNKTDIANLVKLVGSLPVSTEAKTIVEYIDSKVGAIDYSDAIAEAKQAAIDAAATDATTKANKAEENAKKYADGLAKNYATAEQGTKADSALQKADITEGLTNGTVSIKGEDISVHGLGSAAYQNVDAFDAKGSATQALTDAKAYADSKVDGVDLSGIATNATAIEALDGRVGTAEGKLTTIQGTGAGSITKAVGDAKTELEGKIKTNADAIGVLNGTGDGSVSKAVSDAKSALQEQITANKGVIDKLDGDASTEGSVKKQIADAKTAIEKEIEDSKYNDVALSGRVTAVEGKVTTLTGADTVDGSVSKQVKDAKTDVEGKIGDLTTLDTAAKDTLVKAVNELKGAVDNTASAGEVTVDTATTTAGMAKSYTIKQGGKTVTTIDIPKDMVVKSGTVEKNPTGQTAGTYLVLTLANADEDKVYINVGTLVDIYTAKASATQIQLAIDSATREISATVVAGSIGTTELAANAVTTAKIADGNVTKAKLATDVQASLEKADSALQAADIADLKSDVANVKTSLAEGGATAKAIAEAKKAGTDAQADVDALGTRVEALEGIKFVEITEEQINSMFA